jgi:hypothetical protein
LAPCHWNKRPYEGLDEIVLFQYFVERGLALPTSDFSRGLLFYYGIQLHHLNPNSILHISIFVQFCEVFLGTEPHFDLFTYLFHLKSQPNNKVPYEVGGAGLQLRQGMEKKYISYKFPSSLLVWRQKWFYIGNHAPSLLERTAGVLKIMREWSKPCRDESQIPKLLGMIKKIVGCGCYWRSSDLHMDRQADPVVKPGPTGLCT